MKNLFLLSSVLLSLFLMDVQAQLPPDSKFKSSDEVIQSVFQAMVKQSFLKIIIRKKDKDKMGNVIFGEKLTSVGNITLLKGEEFFLSDNCFMCDDYVLKYDEVVSISRKPKALRWLRNQGELTLLVSLTVLYLPVELVKKGSKKIKH
jgi:hypothetical protein